MKADNAFSMKGEDGYPEVMEGYKKALRLSESLSEPTASDLFERREIYRYLGMVTFLMKGNDYLRRAEDCYNSGMPLEEARDLSTVIFYTYTLNALYEATGDLSYRRKLYDIACRIHRTRFDDLGDDFYKREILLYIISEKLQGDVCPKDLNGASALNETLGQLENCQGKYREVRKLISQMQGRRGILGKLFGCG